MKRYSLTPHMDGRERPLPRYVGSRQAHAQPSLNECVPLPLSEPRLSEVATVVLHKPSVAVTLVADMHSTVVLRSCVVAWRAFASHEAEHDAPRATTTLPKRWSRQPWRYNVLNIWLPRRLFKKYFGKWAHAFYHVHKEEQYRHAARLTSSFALQRQLQWRRYQTMFVYYTAWSRHVYQVLATAILAEQRPAFGVREAMPGQPLAQDERPKFRLPTRKRDERDSVSSKSPQRASALRFAEEGLAAEADRTTSKRKSTQSDKSQGGLAARDLAQAEAEKERRKSELRRVDE